MKHIVMFSGGAGSWMTAKRVVKEHGPADVVLLFADTRMEDPDLYRFLKEAAEDVGAPLEVVADGRDVWDVFFERRFLGNTRVDLCSRILKREVLLKWLQANAPSATVYLGIDWTESHRFERAVPRWGGDGYAVRAPLCDAPFLTKDQILAELAAAGIAPPRLYGLGFPHNNCGGFCVKAGQAHFRLLLEKLPDLYAYHEGREEELRQYLGKDVAILRDRTGGRTRPMTLREFRERQDYDKDEWGGCGCLTGT